MSRYLVQTRGRGEPWLTVQRYEDRADAERCAVTQANQTRILDALTRGLVLPLHAYVRVISKGRLVFDPRAAHVDKVRPGTDADKGNALSQG